MNPLELSAELSTIKSGFLPEPLFNQIARLGVLVFIELIALRENNGQIEVLLTKRSDQDTFWPNQYHHPGTVLRPNDIDHSLASAFDRLYKDEFKCAPPQDGPFFAGLYFKQQLRGKGFGLINWIELSDCSVGEYLPVNDLPKNLVKGQNDYIQKCAVEFSKYKKGVYKPIITESLMMQPQL